MSDTIPQGSPPATQGYFWRLLVEEDMHILNLEFLCKYTILKILFLSFLIKKLQCFEVDSFIEKLIIIFVSANLLSKLWCSL